MLLSENRILVTHLTRMQPGYICAAGLVAPEFRRHIRPVLAYGRVPRSLLASEGGVFCLGRVVNLGPLTPRPVPPEIEDHVFEAGACEKVEDVTHGWFWLRIGEASTGSLREVFGPNLAVHGGRPTGAVQIGRGTWSLGILRPSGPVELEKVQSGDRWELRLKFDDPDLGSVHPPVTDLRLWDADHKTPRHQQVDRIVGRLDGCLLGVGLSRPFQPRGYPEPLHWLQVNAIFPRIGPLWIRE
jgi:hypothetical protein